MTKIKDIILESKIFRTTVLWAKKIIIPGFEGLSLFEIVDFLIEALKRGGLATKGTAIAFGIFLAFFPCIIFFLSLIPYVPIDNFQNDLLAEIFGLMPDGIRPMVEDTIHDLILKKHSGVLSVGFLLTFYFASNSINSILKSFNNSYQFEIKQNPIKQRLLSFGLLLLFTILIVLAVVIILFGESAISYLEMGFVTSIMLNIFKWLIILFLIFIAISMLYNVGNPERVKWRVISAGTSLTTVVIILTSLGFGYYIDNFGKFNELYGSIGSLIAFLIWIQICSRILLIGFELSAKVQKQLETKSN